MMRFEVLPWAAVVGAPAAEKQADGLPFSGTYVRVCLATALLHGLQPRSGQSGCSE